MGKITIHPPSTERRHDSNNALPTLLQTPSGLALLEIQGSLNSTTPENEDGTRPAIDIGKLTFPLYDPAKQDDDKTWQKRVHLFVGDNQRLTGELRKLQSPLAVLRRRETDTMSDADDLEVAEIIYYKLIFAHRPEPFGSAAQE